MAWRSLVSCRALMAISCAGLLSSCGGDGGTPAPPPPPAPPPIADALPATPGDWVRLTPRDAVIQGVNVHPTCSGAPGTDPTYHFYARRGTGKGLMVFFGGGGACWDGESCARPTTGSQAVLEPRLFFAETAGDDPAKYGGVLNPADPASPVRDWSMVYIPSCNGDLHTGSATQSYLHPVTQQPFTIEHRGADNVRVVTEWMKANFTDPDQLFLLGSSAGGVGAVVHYPGLRQAFPSARGALLIESAPTLMPEVFESRYRRHWNVQLDATVWGSQAAPTPVANLMKPLARHYPMDRFAQYTAAADMTLISYFDKMAHGVTSQPSAATCGAWVDGIAAQLADHQSEPNFRSYRQAGTTHSIMGWPFTDTTAPVARWAGEMLSASGAGWVNTACTDCDQTAYCAAP